MRADSNNLPCSFTENRREPLPEADKPKGVKSLPCDRFHPKHLINNPAGLP